MKFTYTWLKKFLKTEASVEVIKDTLNAIGFEVEAVTDRSKELKDFTVAEILETTPHPSADKLKVCKVLSGDGELQIVCGAPNARAGIKVILAKVGALVPNGNFKIKTTEIRGVSSCGMLCSESELMIGSSQDGIVELPGSAVVGEEFAKYYGLDDPVIEIAVTPNRGDCLGVYYIAKELAAKGVGEVIDISVIASEAWQSSTTTSRSPQDSQLLAMTNTYPTFATINITDIQNKPSPEWLQTLLKNIGQTPISAVVDITNYICISFNRPLHAYDSDKLSGDLEVNFAKNGDKFVALNGKEYELSDEDLVVCDSRGVQCLAGIIGGALSSCNLETKNITVEAAIFDPITVSKSARRHKIDTDSSHRCERGLDPTTVIAILKYAAEMIQDICGGKCSEVVQYSAVSVPQKKLTFDPQELERVVGINLAIEEIAQILKKLDFEVVIEEGGIMNLTIPPFRHDISIQEDIVEEIVRIYGYEHIPCVPLPDRHIARVLTTLQRRSFDSRRILASRGYDELVTWSFVDSTKLEIFSEINQSLKLQNPISSELDYMRPSIIPNILEIMTKNLSRSMQDLAFFEVGPVFGEVETVSISGAKIGKIGNKNPHTKPRDVDIFDIKSDVEFLLSEMGIMLDKCSLKDAPRYYHPYRSAGISLGKANLGFFGEIHPSILEEYDIEGNVVAFEINLNAIPESKLKYGYKGIFSASDYQLVSRDFAFTVDAACLVGPMISEIKALDKKLIQDVYLFDVYTGDKINQGYKSIAFNVIFQAPDRTLNEEEINVLSANIVDTMGRKYGAVLRG